GFTLIEIAIVLVIIGLLLGGVLKGQELITSARVRNLIAQQDGIKAAYFGFQDRYRALPGDYPGALANANIPNVAATLGGNGDGQILNTAGANEQTIAWTHLSHAGFLTGSYNMATATDAVAQANTPSNSYNAFLQIIYDNNYDVQVGDPAATSRHNLKAGNQVPVEILTEVDRKIDDADPGRGTFRSSEYLGAGTAPTVATCADLTNGVWLTTGGQTNCGGASLF
ncbi:MAG TPA: prepilin-type N-terminal cleavage/methylation domain-containing protein, partial [Burkholderiales bacterium]|nr:prepilin-type N-terminal cleavage/methylation domain-containing protein [Burkholderiales bacterium]